VEFASLFALGEVRVGVLERMPPPELKATVMDVVSENKPVGSTHHQIEDLIDSEVPSAAGPTPNGQTATNENLIDELFGSSPSPSPSTVASSTRTQKSTVDDIMGLFDSSAPAAVSSPTQPLPSNAPSAFSLPQTQSPQPPAAPRLTSYNAYDNNELKVTLTPQTVAGRPGVVNILARFQTAGGNPVTGLTFQAAVPKSQQLQMLPMSSPHVNPGAIETQQMRVVAPVGSNIRLRLRISFLVAGRAVQDQVDFGGFPPDLTSGS